jgi:Tol biopolymer transport system component
MNIDGANIHQITPNNETSFSPSWSRDSNIVYYGCGFEGYDEICLLNLQTSESQILTDIRNSLPNEEEHYLIDLDINSDNQIIFQLFASRNIYLFNPKDGSITNLTEGDTSDNHLLGWVSLTLNLPMPTNAP